MHRIRLVVVLSLVTLLIGAGTALAVLGDTGFYKGRTSQGKTFSFKLVQNGRKITNGNISWNADCQVVGPNGYRDRTTFIVQVSRTGVFSLSGGYTADLGSGFTGDVKANLNGHFPGHRRAIGIFRGRVTVTDSTGQVVDHCDSGKITWHASHQ